MYYSLSQAQLRRLSGHSSSQGIWLSDGVISTGIRFFVREQMILSCLLGLMVMGFFHALMFPILEGFFFRHSESMIAHLLLYVEIFSLDIVLSFLFILLESSLFMSKKVKQFHALEHKILNVLKEGRSVTAVNIRSASSLFWGCGVNLVSLYFVFAVFCTSLPLLLIGGTIAILFFVISLCVLIVEYRCSYIGYFLQRKCFLRKPSYGQIPYALALCKEFFRRRCLFDSRELWLKLKV